MNVFVNDGRGQIHHMIENEENKFSEAHNQFEVKISDLDTSEDYGFSYGMFLLTDTRYPFRYFTQVIGEENEIHEEGHDK